MSRPSRRKVEANCVCGSVKSINEDTYNANIKKNGQYICHKCATIKAGVDGKYSHSFEIRSAQSKKLWTDQEFRKKITETSIIANTTIEYKTEQAERTKELWKNEVYKAKVSDGVRETLSDEEVRKKISDGLKARYFEDLNYRKAVGHAAKLRFLNDDYRKKMAVIRSNQPRISSLQLKLYSYLDDLNVKYDKEGPNTSIGYYVFDCHVPHGNKHLLIECQGNYWHGSDVAAARDRAKFTYIDRYFPDYEIMYVWEHEFIAKDRVLDRLKLKLGIDIQTIDFSFSDLVVKVVETSEVRSFLDQYHYIGGRRGGIAIVALYHDEIIAAILFSKPVRQNHSHLFGEFMELSRLCIHPSYHKKNFGSWFIAKSLPFVPVNKIVAYADTTVGHSGTVYKASNFTLSHRTPVSYWYVDFDGYVTTKKSLYERAVNLKLTETAYAEKYGYRKKFGGEKLCYVYSKSNLK